MAVLQIIPIAHAEFLLTVMLILNATNVFILGVEKDLELIYKILFKERIC
jgi:hypothetical protein